MPVRNFDANLSLKISKYKEASFLKDWSDNVSVFFKLVRYRRKFLRRLGFEDGENEHIRKK